MSDHVKIILVTGSREPACGPGDARYHAERLLTDVLQKYLPGKVLVVHGAARGWDSAFDEAARKLGIHVEPFPAAWDQHRLQKPNPAGFMRNEEMVRWVCELALKRPTHLVCWAFANERNSGTGHCARLARKASIYVEDYGVSTV